MKFLKIVIIMGLLTNLLGCGKLEKIKNKMNPGSPYKKAGIDRFYWEAEDNETYMIPLIKPYHLYRIKASEEWGLIPNIIQNELFAPLTFINAKDGYIYGLKDYKTDEAFGQTIVFPAFYFVINVNTNEIKRYDYKQEKKQFEEELRKLNLPEKYLEPQNIYWEFERYPDLEWFPEDIKKKLNEVKSSLKDK